MVWRRARGERGAAALEFAILVPVLVLIICEIIAWSYMFSFRQALSEAADEGARAAVGASTAGCPTTSSWNIAACAPGSAAATAVGNVLNGYSHQGTRLACGMAGLQCTIQQSSTCASGHICISVTVYYPYSSQPLLPVIPSQIPPFSVVAPPDLSFTSVVQVS